MISFFHKIIDVLDELKIPYMLSGSVAMGVYVLTRSTRDFDFVIFLQPDTIDKFVSNFSEGYCCSAEAVADAVKHQSIFNIIDHSSGYKAEFVILKDANYRQVEFARKIQMEYFGKIVYIVSVEDLLLSKLIWIQELQSGVQIEDVKNLAQLKTLNWNYINKWIKDLNLQTFNIV